MEKFVGTRAHDVVHRSSSPLETLASAFLLQMVKDWQDERNRAEIREFMRSDVFPLWTDVVDISPAVIRSKLESGDYQLQEIRAGYR